MTKMETRSTQVENGWQDQDGFVGPFQPGNGPRSDPQGDFPTGPAVGTLFPDISAMTADGGPWNLHSERAGGPAILLAFRSAVW